MCNIEQDFCTQFFCLDVDVKVGVRPGRAGRPGRPGGGNGCAPAGRGQRRRAQREERRRRARGRPQGGRRDAALHGRAVPRRGGGAGGAGGARGAPRRLVSAAGRGARGGGGGGGSTGLVLQRGHARAGVRGPPRAGRARLGPLGARAAGRRGRGRQARRRPRGGRPRGRAARRRQAGPSSGCPVCRATGLRNSPLATLINYSQIFNFICLIHEQLIYLRVRN